MPVDGSYFEIQFLFDNTADNCVVTLYQQATENLFKEGEKVVDVAFTSNILETRAPYTVGKGL